MIESHQGHLPEIHSTAYVHSTAVLIGRVWLAQESSVWPRAVLRGDDGDIRLGEKSNIQDGSAVHLTQDLSIVDIGPRVTVGHNVVLHGCRVASDALIGMGSVIMDNAEIGSQVIIGAGTVIPMKKKIPDGVLVLGNPFRIVRDLQERDLQWIAFSWQWYVQQAKNYVQRDHTRV